MWTSKNRARYDRSKLRYPSDLTDDYGVGAEDLMCRQALDRRAHHCLAQSLPKARKGLLESQPKGARVLAPRLNPPHA
jgi:hypothetical protein